MQKKQQQRRQFRHLNQSDRDRIEALQRAGHDQQVIAVVLQVDKGTISRELKRKRKNGYYCASTAEQKARVKRLGSKYQGMKIEQYPLLRERIMRELKEKRSPDEIAGHMKKEGIVPRVGTNAIYKWLYSVYGQRYCSLLCTKRYHKKSQKQLPKRVMIPDRIPFMERPREGEHAEGDLFVSPTKSGTKKSGVLLCVPSAKLLVGQFIKNRKPSTMVGAVNTLLPALAVQDITWDNGIENRQHQEFLLPSYFCDPHSPWQKPHVENGIGLLRRWFLPKKTDLKHVSEQALQSYLHCLNGKYRKSLGYRSAYEVALERGIIQKIPATSEEE
jgi:transposase, IS30 family